MAIGTPKSSPELLHLLILILLITPPPSHSLSIPTNSFHTLLSLSHSLLSRVANLRAARGDISGSIRARSKANKIEKHSHEFSFYGVIMSVGWDYLNDEMLKNYTWRDVGMASFEMLGAVSDTYELIRALNELTWLESEVISGSIRARSIANKIEKHSHEFSFYGVIMSVGWDYLNDEMLKNYTWRDVGMASFEMLGAVSDMYELIRALNELTRLESQVERLAWVRRNYGTVLKGPLKDAVEMVRTEIVDGGLLRDCLELGSSDLKDVIQILKDVASQYSSTSSKTEL